MTLPLRVGDIVHGPAGGAFGRDHYHCSRVEAIGSDWVVVRPMTHLIGWDAKPCFADGDPETLTQYRAFPDECECRS